MADKERSKRGGRVTRRQSAKDASAAARDRRAKEAKARASRAARAAGGSNVRGVPATKGTNQLAPRVLSGEVQSPSRDVATRTPKSGPTIEGTKVPPGGKVVPASKVGTVRSLMGKAFGRLVPALGLVLTAAEVARYVSERDGDKAVDRSQPAGSSAPSVRNSPNNPANREKSASRTQGGRGTYGAMPTKPAPVGQPTKRPAKPAAAPVKTKPAKGASDDLSSTMLNKLMKAGVKAKDLNSMSRDQVRALAKKKGISG